MFDRAILVAKDVGVQPLMVYEDIPNDHCASSHSEVFGVNIKD